MNTVALTIVTPTFTDERGTPMPDWTDPQLTAEAWYGIQPLTPSENVAMGRQATVTTLRGFGPYSSVITDKCRVIYGVTTYEVLTVARWVSISGELQHTEATFGVVDG